MLHGEPQFFVKMAVTEQWLCKSVTGHTFPQRTSISRTTLLQDLGDRIRDAANGAGGSKDAELSADPMNEVEGGMMPPAKRLKRNWRRSTNHAKNTCIVTDFPSTCPEKCPECTESRSVTLYVVDRTQIWLFIEDVAWAVGYMHDQNVLKGVAAVSEEDTGPVGAAPASPTHLHHPQTDFSEKIAPNAVVPGVASVVAEEEVTN